MKKYFFVVATSFAFLYVASTFLAVTHAQSVSPTPTPTATPSGTSVPSVTPTPTPSSTPTKLSGWGWSSNIGWINLSTVNILRSSGGNLDGYAWSSNIGWVRFGGLSSFPSGGTPSTNAKVDLFTGAVTGWARACAGTVNNSPNQNLPGNCSSMTSRTDGWDGWIELSGTNHTNTAMSLSTGVINGYAWGGPVVGWVGLGNVAAPVQQALAATCSGSLVGSTVTFTGSASGGSGTLLYSWNGIDYGTYSTPNPSIIKTQTPPLTTATFYIKDSVSQIVAPAECKFPADGSGTTITGSCLINGTSVTASSNTVIDPDTDVLITPDQTSPTNGNGNYSYNWYIDNSTSLGSNRIYKLIKPVGTFKNIRVNITDTAGASGVINCGNFSAGSVQSMLDLRIGSTKNEASSFINGDSTKGKSIHVRKGDDFGLSWINGYSKTNYDIKSIISNQGNNIPELQKWINSVNVGGSLSGEYSSASIPTGRYELTITTYTKGTLDVIDDTSVTLEVYSVSQGEM